ncbi:MAG: hypothetical protein DUW69_001364, partial [Verrucomicrobia bacterium]
PAALAHLLSALESYQAPIPAANVAREHWVFGQMSRAALELSAMLLAASPPTDATTPVTALG